MWSFIRHGVTQRECEPEIPFQIMAGSETTAISLRTTMLFLMSSPQAYSTLRKEIDAAIEDFPTCNCSAMSRSAVFIGLHLRGSLSNCANDNFTHEESTIRRRYYRTPHCPSWYAYLYLCKTPWSLTLTPIYTGLNDGLASKLRRVERCLVQSNWSLATDVSAAAANL
ncbi:hypothetical protein GGR57DRAFT_317444 [Xylariaceae sp. FL1272]|nr:hypothetical protein GGR57DRAFT_317444 [Xylariaceae sp. FL1272]